MYKRKAPLVRFRRVLLTFTLGLTLQSSEKPAQVVVKLGARVGRKAGSQLSNWVHLRRTKTKPQSSDAPQPHGHKGLHPTSKSESEFGHRCRSGRFDGYVLRTAPAPVLAQLIRAIQSLPWDNLGASRGHGLFARGHLQIATSWIKGQAWPEWCPGALQSIDMTWNSWNTFQVC